MNLNTEALSLQQEGQGQAGVKAMVTRTTVRWCPRNPSGSWTRGMDRGPCTQLHPIPDSCSCHSHCPWEPVLSLPHPLGCG